MTGRPVVTLSGVTKRFSGHTAVERLALEVPEGSIYGLLGPNGAGKTTTLRMMLDIIRPDEGRVEVFGQGASRRRLSRRIGYLPEERGLYQKMRVLDLVVFFAVTRGLSRREAAERAREWLGRMGLSDWRGRRVNELSKGMQQKVQFISTLVHQPELVILDEPFAGLDPVNRQALEETVVQLTTGGVTIVFSTHIMEQAERLCDAVCIISRGRKVVDGPLRDVRRAHGTPKVAMIFSKLTPRVEAVLGDRALVAAVARTGEGLEAVLVEGRNPQELLRELVTAGAEVTKFEQADPSLHQIFLDRVGADAAEMPSGDR